MESAFVIQIHSGHGPTHYDLMLEAGQALATWRLDRPPTELSVGQEVRAEKLPDHRRAYLTYEGPVSRGRGEVRVLDRGAYDAAEASDERWMVTLRGRRVRGCFEIAHCQDGWLLRRVG